VEVVKLWVRVVRFEGGTSEGLNAETADVKEQMANAEQWEGSLPALRA
jgi:hypothetical protein